MMADALASTMTAGIFASAGDGPFDAGELILHHVSDFGYEDWPIWLTKASVMMIVAAVLVMIGMRRAVAGYDDQGVPRSRWSQMIDPFVAHFYRDVAIKYTGEKWAKRVTPLLLNFFFFILTCNLLGLLPLGESVSLVANLSGLTAPAIVQGATTATGNFQVTMALAVVTFFAIMGFGIAQNGVIGYFSQLAPKNAPFLVRWFLLLPIETLSMFVKPFALTMRLAANMTAGHMGLLALMSIIFIIKSSLVGIPVALLAVGMLLLEIIVCFVQAYVFALLSGIFIGMALHPHH